MTLDDLIESLERLKAEGDTKTYIRFGLHQVPIDTVEYYPETDAEYGAVIIS